MGWKQDLQVRDLAETQRLEATCKTCGNVHYVDVPRLQAEPSMAFVYVDELEAQTHCRARGCHGAVRLALVLDGDTKGFVGGLA